MLTFLQYLRVMEKESFRKPLSSITTPNRKQENFPATGYSKGLLKTTGLGGVKTLSYFFRSRVTGGDCGVIEIRRQCWELFGKNRKKPGEGLGWGTG